VKKTKKSLRKKGTGVNAQTTEMLTEKNTELTKRIINENTERNISTYIGLIQWNRNHSDNQMTYEQYVAYRQNKERQKETKENE